MRRAMSGMGRMMFRSQSPDHALLEMTTPHHGSAGELTNIALENGRTDHMLGTAKRIMDEVDQIHDFRDRLRTYQ